MRNRSLPLRFAARSASRAHDDCESTAGRHAPPHRSPPQRGIHRRAQPPHTDYRTPTQGGRLHSTPIGRLSLREEFRSPLLQIRQRPPPLLQSPRQRQRRFRQHAGPGPPRLAAPRAVGVTRQQTGSADSGRDDRGGCWAGLGSSAHRLRNPRQ